MKVAVLRFPGSNCDQDAVHSLRDDVGVGADYVWYESTSLSGFDAVFIPGGFSFGDYLRCGAMAATAPIMSEVRRFAQEGRPVIGACNGFQILCETGILPGALLKNESQKFVCKHVIFALRTARACGREASRSLSKYRSPTVKAATFATLTPSKSLRTVNELHSDTSIV